ncbi:hypothetical protein BJY52DRAFT_1194415 [Lactarius psammicola]|nr:hypothetical protein BJY52DRAFT_1194415 [Lactarius psammicola]
MAPRTHRALKAMRNQAEGGLDSSHVSLEQATSPDVLNRVKVVGQDVINKDSDNLQTNLIAKKRRTSPSYKNTGIHTNLAARASDSNPAKRTRKVALSFYPRYNGASIFDHTETKQLPDPISDEHTEDEEDWIDEQAEELTVLPQGLQEKAMAIERPSWTGSALSTGKQVYNSKVPVGHDDSATVPTLLPATAFVPPTAKASVPLEASATNQPQGDTQTQSPSVWSVDTDIQFIPGTNRVILTMQVLALSFIRDALITAAGRCGPTTALIYTQLLNDKDYLMKIVPLPCARISLFRGEVKECCSSIISTVFLAMSSKMEVACYVQAQTLNYNYTFPGGLNSASHQGHVMRSKPYRNRRIIDAIHNLFFSGGRTSFANRFNYLFPSSETLNGVTVYEVPVPMVALVATALYAALYEWRTGEHQVMEFSANSYLDVYQGHVNTLRLIQKKRGSAFRSMMANIYSQANTTIDIGAPSGAPIAQLDIDDLEE